MATAERPERRRDPRPDRARRQAEDRALDNQHLTVLGVLLGLGATVGLTVGFNVGGWAGVIGGILSSLFLTLVLVPIMYMWLSPARMPATEKTHAHAFWKLLVSESLCFRAACHVSRTLWSCVQLLVTAGCDVSGV